MQVSKLDMNNVPSDSYFFIEFIQAQYVNPAINHKSYSPLISMTRKSGEFLYFKCPYHAAVIEPHLRVDSSKIFVAFNGAKSRREASTYMLLVLKLRDKNVGNCQQYYGPHLGSPFKRAMIAKIKSAGLGGHPGMCAFTGTTPLTPLHV